MNEQDLDELLALVTGRGRWAWTGPFLHTHPCSGDQPLHEGCVELERRGLIRRCIDEPEHVCWEGVPPR